MIPKATSPPKSANRPNPITTTPADLKKRLAYLELAKEEEPKDNNRSTGKVPKAKANIIKLPLRNDPLDRATTCID